jgi:hypothetical protein
MNFIRPLILVLFIATSVFAKGTGRSPTSGSHASKSSSVKSTKPKSSGATNKNVVHVKSYKKKNGTVVQAHDRTAPNRTQKDNWSTKGNVNLETGKVGTKTPKN